MDSIESATSALSKLPRPLWKTVDLNEWLRLWTGVKDRAAI